MWQDIASIRQVDKAITDYLTRLCIIWDKLESYWPNPFCTCNLKCTCDALVSVMERKKQDRVMQFLRGLNDQFNTLRSNVLMMEQERQFNNNDMIGNNSLINATSTTSSNSELQVLTMAKTIIQLIGISRRMVSLKTMVLEEEKVTRVALAEKIPVGKETSFVNTVVSLTTQLMNVTRSMVILPGINTISLKAQTSII